MKDLRPIPGIADALRELRRRGYRTGVLTSNSEANVRAFASHNSLEFDFVYGGGQLFAKDELLKKMMEESHLSRDQMIYVGDETRDIEAAKKVNVKVIAVAWGFNSTKILNQYHPDQLIHLPAGPFGCGQYQIGDLLILCVVPGE